jgi:hypothetical protein
LKVKDEGGDWVRAGLAVEQEVGPPLAKQKTERVLLNIQPAKVERVKLLI